MHEYCQVANVGDSASIFVDPSSGAFEPLSCDHRLTNPSERTRLQGMGIQLSNGRTRLYGLNLSRCLGDKFLKDEDLGLCAEPFSSTVKHFDANQGGVVVIATDGLWDVTTEETVAKLATSMDK